MHNKTAGLGILLLLLCLSSFAQDIFPPDPVKKKLTAVQIAGNLRIDGRLDEPEWQLAAPVKDFIQMDPDQGALAKKRTVVRLLYNRTYLYMSAICYDTVGRDHYRVLNFKRDYVAGNTDFFAFAIDGYNDERNAVMFGMNPYGVQRDLLSFDDNYFDPDWDGLWLLRTQRTDTAWIAEVAVPWKTLRYKNRRDSLQTWGISFGRIARANNESSAWPAFPRAYGGLRMSYAAKLVDIDAPKPATNIRIQPYWLYAWNESKENAKTVRSNTTLKPGGDIKWAVNPNTLLDLTFNTDFAQADVDRQVNNVQRFSVFYPERRPFFLENAGLFSVGLDPQAAGLTDYAARIQPFFSRAIGLDTNGSPLNIDAGARLVYRSEKISAGGLLIRQEGNAHTEAASFMMGRYSQNVGKQNRIGALLSTKIEDHPGKRNLTGTLDGFFRFSQGLSWSYMGSVTTDENDRRGYAASSQLFYNTNTWIAWWNESIVTRKYDPQMGFVSRGNALVTDPGLILQVRGKWLPRFIRSYNPGVSFTLYHDARRGELTDRYINLNPLTLQLQHGGLLSWNMILTRQVLTDNFSPLGVSISPGSYDYTRHKVTISSDPSKRMAGALTANLGQFYNGHYHSLTAAATFTPAPYFFIAPNVEIGRISRLGTNAVSKNTTLYTIEGRVALNPRLQLSGLFQQSNTTHLVSWNARLSWEFQPLSYCYIVYNKNSLNQAVRITDQQAIVKLTYLRQF